jgi:hypothetical protein
MRTHGSRSGFAHGGRRVRVAVPRVSTTLLLPKEHNPSAAMARSYSQCRAGMKKPRSALLRLIRFPPRPIRFSFSNPIPNLNVRPQKPFGRDLDINNPVADDC